MSIRMEAFGRLPTGEQITRYTMTNQKGAEVSVLNYGGILNRIVVPDKHGKMGDVLLGYDRVEGYAPVNPGYLGALIGRYANRIGAGRCTLNGRALQLAQNSNGQHLHGGNVGFDKKLWGVFCEEGAGEDRLVMSLTSPDGEENYPGTLTVRVTYTWNDECELKLHYEAVCDQDTIVNLTNHAYFNLEGEGSGSIENHTLSIDADRYTVVDKNCISTGELRPVDGTPFDLRKGVRLADGFARQAGDEQMTIGQGYDHNFVLNGQGLRQIAVLSAPISGRVMRVYTNKPGVQLYTGNMIDCTVPGKSGRVYQKRDALCLETQFYPDSINHPDFPSCVLRAGEKYDFTTIYAFE